MSQLYLTHGIQLLIKLSHRFLGSNKHLPSLFALQTQCTILRRYAVQILFFMQIFRNPWLSTMKMANLISSYSFILCRISQTPARLTQITILTAGALVMWLTFMVPLRTRPPIWNLYRATSSRSQSMRKCSWWYPLICCNSMRHTWWVSLSSPLLGITIGNIPPPFLWGQTVPK